MTQGRRLCYGALVVIRYREADNMPRGDPLRRGWFESYYVKLNDPSSKRGWWLRYTFVSPASLESPPEATLWGFVFDRSDRSRNFSLKESFPMARSRFDPDIFYVQIGEAAIYTMGARGRLEGKGHSLEWDLKFDTEGISSRIYPVLLYGLPWPATKFLSPYFDTHISGRIAVDGEPRTLNHVKGHEGHLWGRRTAAEWAWVHCNDFSGEEGVAVELLSAPALGGVKTLFHLRLPDQDFKASDLLFPHGLLSRREPHEWVVEVSRGRHRIVVRAVRDPRNCHTLTPSYPDGSSRLVANSSVADCEILIFEKEKGSWREAARYVSNGAAAFETGGS